LQAAEDSKENHADAFNGIGFRNYWPERAKKSLLPAWFDAPKTPDCLQRAKGRRPGQTPHESATLEALNIRYSGRYLALQMYDFAPIVTGLDGSALRFQSFTPHLTQLIDAAVLSLGEEQL
jgi:hypothetical protein